MEGRREEEEGERQRVTSLGNERDGAKGWGVAF